MKKYLLLGVFLAVLIISLPHDAGAALAIGSRVKTTADLNVRSTPSIYGTKLGTQLLGAQGAILKGYVIANGYVWWNVDFDNAPDGWVVKNYLAEISITTSPPPTPIPTPVSAKFQIGDRVQVNAEPLNVRSIPSKSGTILGTKIKGALGAISSLPNNAGAVNSDGYWWWYVNFDSGADGWVVEDYLDKVNIVTASSITVLSPNGGESWTKGTTKVISWKSNYNNRCDIGATGGTCALLAPQTIDIFLGSWSPPCTVSPCPVAPNFGTFIAKGINDNGIFSWEVGNGLIEGTVIPESKYTITVFRSDGFSDTSDAPFSIVATSTCPPGTIQTGQTNSIPPTPICTPIITPSITAISPVSGPVGTNVSITGTGFTSTGNMVTFGFGGIPNLNSADGKTISFKVPSSMNAGCYYSVPQCLMPAISVVPGQYQVSVKNSNGTSNALTFTVTTTTTTPPPPAVTLTANSSTGSLALLSGQSLVLAWSSVNTSGCYIGTDVNNTSIRASSGTLTIFPGESLYPKAPTTYQAKCLTQTVIGSYPDFVIASVTVSPPATQPSITVLSPNGGESWTRGTARQISFNSAFPVNIYLSPQNNLNGYYVVLATNVASPFNWAVGQPNVDNNPSGTSIADGRYYICISNRDTGQSDCSDTPFSIVAAPAAAKYIYGDFVEVAVSSTNVYDSVNRTSIVGTQQLKSIGTITAGPESSGVGIIWLVRFETGVSGWVVDPALRFMTANLSIVYSPQQVFATSSPQLFYKTTGISPAYLAHYRAFVKKNGSFIGDVFGGGAGFGNGSATTVWEKTKYGNFGNTALVTPASGSGYTLFVGILRNINKGPIARDLDSTTINNYFVAYAETAPFTVVPAPLSPPISTKFTKGDGINVLYEPLYTHPTYDSGASYEQKTVGSVGRVIGGPVNVYGLNMWNIDFEKGEDGWVIEDYISKTSSTNPTPTPCAIPTPPSGCYVQQNIGSCSYSTVCPTPTGQPTPTPSSTSGLSIGSRVKTAYTVNIRETAGGTIKGYQYTSAQGTVIDGPITAGIYVWWKVDFDSGADGWAAGSYLTAISGTGPVPTPTPIISGTPTPTPILGTNPANAQGLYIGSRIKTAYTVNIRETAGGTIKGYQYTSAQGTVIDGPVTAGIYVWWKVDFDSGADGWAAGSYLTAISGTGPVPTPTPIPTSCLGGQCSPTPTPAPTSSSTNTSVFQIGSRIKTAYVINIRSTPNGTIAGTQYEGVPGTVIDGPVTAGIYVWWKVDFDSGADGWAAGRYLQ